MQIVSVEVKTASNNNTYKQVSFSEKAYGKDRTNVFSNHPMYNELVVGFDIPVSELEINQKGYLELKGGVKGGARAAQSTGGFTDQDRTRMMSIEALCIHMNNVLNREFKDKDDKTPAYPEYSGQPNYDETINPEDRPF